MHGHTVGYRGEAAVSKMEMLGAFRAAGYHLKNAFGFPLRANGGRLFGNRIRTRLRIGKFVCQRARRLGRKCVQNKQCAQH